MRASTIGLLLAMMPVGEAPGLAAETGPRAAGAADQDRPAAVLTAKERPTGKARDEQRVNDCKVPVELRGPQPRPTECAARRPPSGEQRK
jgi:hypothetical protein